ncbi:energy-coupling factor ABC transporter ATP-binding protein [Corynebacterium sp. H113]|uniref:energy-coupling factor ABC transporter ATP-binding protein n=1 Tax=Corynebacterium sp. H113 TaxID=3133419 RepID=UPI0030B49273
MPDPILTASELGFSYPGMQILDAINMDIHPGEKLALLGANGSGKSTLMRMLAGSLVPSTGSISLDDAPYTYGRRGRNRIRGSVQMVTQDPDEQLFAVTVSADVSYGPANQGLEEPEIRARVREAMDAAEISDLADRVPHQLSFGQRKRVALAGALAMRPRILLLDEPTAGLDPASTARLLDTLQRLHTGGTAIVMATHDVNIAWNFAHRAAVIVEKKLVVGEPNDVLLRSELINKARLTLPWAPVVSEALGRTVRTPADILGEK